MIGDEKASNIIGAMKSNVDSCIMGSIGWNVVTKIKSENESNASSSNDSTY